MPQWPEFPGIDAGEDACQTYVNEIDQYPKTASDVCDLVQEGCNNLECGTASPPFPDLCVQLRQIGAGAGCTGLNCGGTAC